MRRPTDIRTLIVDDDPAVAAMHERYLGAIEGFAVVGTAATGDAAVRFAERCDLDLVLLDMHLPDFSGIEVLHRLRSLGLQAAGGGPVDVIVVSSANEPVTVRQAAAALVVGYLVKPFSRSVFELRLVAYREGFVARAAQDRVGALDQGSIDRLFSVRPAPPTTPIAVVHLPKGLAEPTVALVLEAVRGAEISSAADVAERCGLARGTARRYLDFLHRSGRLVVTHRYGVRGRPELLYGVAPG